MTTTVTVAVTGVGDGDDGGGDGKRARRHPCCGLEGQLVQEKRIWVKNFR